LNETAPGVQAQVDWGHLGYLEDDTGEQAISGFTFTLGYSRALMAEVALDQKLGTLLRLHEEAFRQLGGVAQEILYDNMKTLALGRDEHDEVQWHPQFLDFARYWGFTPRLCRPYRAQTKGKVESGVKYVRRNFLAGLQGRAPHSLGDLNAALRTWVAEVANQRVHGTTHGIVKEHWEAEKGALQPLAWPPAVSVRRGRVAAGVARCLCLVASEPVLGAVALRRAVGAGARLQRRGRPCGSCPAGQEIVVAVGDVLRP